MQDQMLSTINWFIEAVPTPNEKTKLVQIGVHFEEVSEMMTSLGLKDQAEEMHQLGMKFKTGAVNFDELAIDRLELLDSLCDQIVTSIGVAHMMKFNIHGAMGEVNRSNWSKYVNGKAEFDENGKIKKGQYYSKPDLTPYM